MIRKPSSFLNLLHWSYFTKNDQIAQMIYHEGLLQIASSNEPELVLVQ